MDLVTAVDRRWPGAGSRQAKVGLAASRVPRWPQCGRPPAVPRWGFSIEEHVMSVRSDSDKQGVRADTGACRSTAGLPSLIGVADGRLPPWTSAMWVCKGQLTRPVSGTPTLPSPSL